MTHDEAVAILQKYVKNDVLLKHSFAAETTMRWLARYFGTDEDVWGATGLLHDADYELSKGHPEKHGLLLAKKEPGIPADIMHAINAHNYKHTGMLPISRLDWAITCCDDLTAFIVATTQKHPTKKINQVPVEYVMNMLRNKKFAKGADREQILLCQAKLGIPILEFVTVTLHAMQSISDLIGL